MKPSVQRPGTLLVEKDARGVVRLTLNRPEIRNAFDGTLINDLTAVLQELAADGGTRALRSASCTTIRRTSSRLATAPSAAVANATSISARTKAGRLIAPLRRPAPPSSRGRAG